MLLKLELIMCIYLFQIEYNDEFLVVMKISFGTSVWEFYLWNVGKRLFFFR